MMISRSIRQEQSWKKDSGDNPDLQSRQEQKKTTVPSSEPQEP